MDKPLVSIITPSFNQGRFIEKTILSVLNQSYTNIEYIIIDGGSTDESLEILDRYRDKVDIIIQEKDNGQSDAINKGFEMASGQLVGWINSDDILYGDCVEKIVELYNENAMASVYYGSKLDFIDLEDQVIKRKAIMINGIKDLLLSDYNIIQQGSFFNRKLVEEVGFLDETLHYCMDLDIWLKMLKRGAVMHFDDYPLAAFRIWGGTKTSTGGIRFLRDISSTLKNHGSPLLTKNMCRISWYMVKEKIKTISQYKKLVSR